MGQKIFRAIAYDRSTEDGVEALHLDGLPLVWTHLDDGLMGGKSQTDLERKGNNGLHFQGTIDSNDEFGWSSARARLDRGLPETTTALSVRFQGDGKTYKVIAMDANHENNKQKSPLWEIDLPTKVSETAETKLLPLQDFTPSFMARQLSADELKKYGPHLKPAEITKIGFMLSSRHSDGSLNPKETYGTGTFPFSLQVESIEAVLGGEPAKE